MTKQNRVRSQVSFPGNTTGQFKELNSARIQIASGCIQRGIRIELTSDSCSHCETKQHLGSAVSQCTALCVRARIRPPGRLIRSCVAHLARAQLVSSWDDKSIWFKQDFKLSSLPRGAPEHVYINTGLARLFRNAGYLM